MNDVGHSAGSLRYGDLPSNLFTILESLERTRECLPPSVRAPPRPQNGLRLAFRSSAERCSRVRSSNGEEREPLLGSVQSRRARRRSLPARIEAALFYLRNTSEKRSGWFPSSSRASHCSAIHRG